MITDLLDQIDRLDQQATKGPWAVWPQMDDDGATYPEYLEGPKNDLFGARGWDGKHYIQEVPELTMDDAEFIALARTFAPAASKALRAVIKECDRLKRVASNAVHADSPARHIVRANAVRQTADSVLEVLQEAIGADDD